MNSVHRSTVYLRIVVTAELDHAELYVEILGDLEDDEGIARSAALLPGAMVYAPVMPKIETMLERVVHHPSVSCAEELQLGKNEG